MPSPEDPSPVSPSSSALETTPPEIFTSILAQLSNRDIKSLRLASRGLCDRAVLRLDRVFLSANARNVEVFLALANHETFRERITEIVWDDARLTNFIPHPDAHVWSEGRPLSESLSPEGCPKWFETGCKLDLEETDFRISQDEDRPDIVRMREQMDAQLPLSESWRYYEQLLIQQSEVLETGADISALQYGLRNFPSLRKITITPAAHGLLFYPLYDTPMIRGFPLGFSYPIPRTWPTSNPGRAPYELQPWSDEREKEKWRGFCIITREIANLEGRGSVSELVLDANYVHTGVNARIFEEASEEYDNFVKVLRRPGFSRLDLALITEQQADRGWPAFRHGLMKRAFREATELEHVSLRAVMNIGATLEPLSDVDVTPLRTILPIDTWQKLRHFGISNLIVNQDDLVATLAALPNTIRTVELSFLTFIPKHEGYRTLVTRLRDTLDWRGRIEDEQPQLTIEYIYQRGRGRTDRFVSVSKSVNDYMYGDGSSPFKERPKDCPHVGMAIWRDAFLPAYDRPNIALRELMQMGIRKKDADIFRGDA